MIHALVVHPALSGNTRSDRSLNAALEEAVGLAHAIELTVLHAAIARLREITPATYIGRGKVEELKKIIEQDEIQLAVVDCALTPVQQRNLEKEWGCKVIDRTALILEIFGARARTAEGKLQVELASLSYQKSRLVRSWTHLERQRGGFGFLGGPGESQIELDRRIIGERIDKIKNQLKNVVRTRELHRATRRDVPYPLIALVGYTNAGKSTLFNRLTKADVIAQDQLFATLDPTIRSVKLPSGLSVLLSDTVGFISNLPTELIAAFRATLEEVLGADILLHIRDIAHDDSTAQKADVEQVLKRLFDARKPTVQPEAEPFDTAPVMVEMDPMPPLIEVHNKIDAWEEIHDARYIPHGEVMPVSAITGAGCDALLERIDRMLAESLLAPAEFVISNSDGKAMAWLYAHGQVLARHESELVSRFTVRLSPANHARYVAEFALTRNHIE
jgi:GTP-binding protein HflX